MFGFLLPKDDYFYNMFDLMCASAVESAYILKQILDNNADCTEASKRLKTIEQENEDIARQIRSYLHKSFVTPIGRDDIFHLVKKLDGIVDIAEGAAARIKLYRPCAVPQEGKALARVLEESTKLVQEMIGLLIDLKKSKKILQIACEIRRLETEADIIRRSTLIRLFKEEKNLYELIKWKEILEFIEQGTDRCQDVAHIVEGVVLENT